MNHVGPWELNSGLLWQHVMAGQDITVYFILIWK